MLEIKHCIWVNWFSKGKNSTESFTEKDLTEEYLQWLNDDEVCRHNSHAFSQYRTKNERLFQRLDTRGVVLAIIDVRQQAYWKYITSKYKLGIQECGVRHFTRR
jgi:hypothetical protein